MKQNGRSEKTERPRAEIAIESGEKTMPRKTLETAGWMDGATPSL